MGSNDSWLSDELYEFIKKGTEYLVEPVIPPTRSLNSCEGHQNGDRIDFSFDLLFSLLKFTSMGVGDFVHLKPTVLSHGHVLWSYMSICKRVETDSYEFSLMSIGPHINQKTDPELNAPKDLKEPEIAAASMVILGKKGEEVMKMTLPQSLVAPKRFSLLQLIGLSVNFMIPVLIRIVVDRSYFSLANIIDLDELPTVSRKRQATIDAILRSEKPVGCVWEVTVPEGNNGQGDTSHRQSFYLHREYIEKAIPIFENYVFDSHYRFIKASPKDEKYFIEITRPDSFEMSTLTAVDMKVIVPLIYGTPVPLPERWERMSTLIHTILKLFSEDILISLTPQWERAICKAALALDTSDVSGLTAIARLLSIVWACPHGSMPVAKRVAVGVMADMVHRNTDGRVASHVRLIPLAVTSLLEGESAPIIISTIMQLNHVARVRKTFLAATKSAATAADPIPAATPISTSVATLDASIESVAARDVVIDVRDVDDEWYDAETIDNKKEEASKWGCTIS